MQVAVAAANFTPAEADQLRRAMGSKRSEAQIDALQQRLYDGMAANGITGAAADEIVDKIKAFAAFGFAESHSISFALLVYASSWLKLHYPAAFCAALINAQPMGFYSPQSLVADARRHGVETRGSGHQHLRRRRRRSSRRRAVAVPTVCDAPQPAVRLGLASVRTIGDDLAEQIVADREAQRSLRLDGRPGAPGRAVDRPGRGAGDRRCLRRVRRDPPGCAVGRRRGGGGPARAARADDRRRAGRPELPVMTEPGADVSPTCGRPGSRRSTLPDGAGPRPARRNGRHHGATGCGSSRTTPGCIVGGVVTHRQRPATARGVTFVNLEDETGMINVICSRRSGAATATSRRTPPRC